MICHAGLNPIAGATGKLNHNTRELRQCRLLKQERLHEAQMLADIQCHRNISSKGAEERVDVTARL
jgi:hypothetical protein